MRTPLAFRITTVALLAATLIGLVVLWPTGDRNERLRAGFARELYEAHVIEVRRAPCRNAGPPDALCRNVVLRLKQGPDSGHATDLEFPTDERFSPKLERGDDLIVSRDGTPASGYTYNFVDRNRKQLLLWVAAAFAVAVVALGRLRGLAALFGLAASFLIIGKFMLPAILDGQGPLTVAIVGAAAIAFVALYSAHGFGAMTTVAMLGTLGSLALTIALAQLVVHLAQFSGLASDEATFLQMSRGEIDLTGLILAGIVIGSLGAIDDMTVTQASVVAELQAANPTRSRVSLFTAAMRVGRDHVASTVNTLALAYAGASLPLLILFVLSGYSIGSIASGEAVAVEIVRTLVGSIGLVASVPLTTWLAVVALPKPAAG